MSVSFVRESQTLSGLMITGNGMSAVNVSRTERQTQRQRRMKMNNVYTCHKCLSDFEDDDILWADNNGQLSKGNNNFVWCVPCLPNQEGYNE